MNFCQEKPHRPGCRIVELRCKEVISICDGNRLGFVSDVEIDTCSGRLAAIVVPARGKWGSSAGGRITSFRGRRFAASATTSF